MLKIGRFDERLDLDILSKTIVQYCGALTPVYNTTASYEIFHQLFFDKWYDQIKKELDTLDIEYNPIENFTRVEEFTHDTTENIDRRNSGSDTVETRQATNVSAYNSSSYEPSEEVQESATTTLGTENKTDRTFNAKDTQKAHGTNGMFTVQEMIEQERRIAEFNIYQWISKKYMEELFICVF